MSHVNQFTRSEVWEELGELFRLIRYFEQKLNNQIWYVWCYRTFQAALLISATIIEFFWDSWNYHETAQTALLASMIVSFWIDDVLKLSTTINVLNEAVAKLNALKSEWRELWGEINTYALDEKMARFKHKQLKRRKDDALSMLYKIDIPLNKKLNLECTKAAKTELQNITRVHHVTEGVNQS